MGIDARGIDLDLPMIQFDFQRLLKILKTNGPERALKTAVRCLFFDNGEQMALRTTLERRGYGYQTDQSRMLNGDASTYDYGREKFDLIYSEDVFEHTPIGDLERLVVRLSELLAPNGVAIIAPIFSQELPVDT